MGRGSQEGAAEYRYLRKAIQVQVREGTDSRHLWEALAARLPVGDGLPTRRELAELRREYEFTRAISARMVEILSVYQVFVLAILLGMGAFVYLNFGVRTNPDLPTRLLQGAFWGALGATAGSLWGLNKHAASRSLRLDTMANHLLKPLLGAVMGVLAILFLPAIGGTGGESAPSLTAYGIAALAGLFEQSFIRKFQAIVDAILGAGNGQTVTAPAPAPVEPDLAVTDEEPEEIEEIPQKVSDPVNEVAAKQRRAAGRKAAPAPATQPAVAQQPPEQDETK